MFCTKCGKQVSDTAKFCTGCGNPIARAEKKVEEDLEAKKKAEEEAAAKKKAEEEAAAKKKAEEEAAAKKKAEEEAAAKKKAEEEAAAKKKAEEEAAAKKKAEEETVAKKSFCTKCGSELKEGSKFCTKCGNVVEAKKEEQKEDKKEDKKEEAKKEEPKKEEPKKEEPKKEEVKEANEKADFCTKCGSKIKPGAKFCTKCGATFGDAPAVKPVDKTAAKAVVKEKKSNPLPIIIAVVVLLLIAGVGGFVGFNVVKKANADKKYEEAINNAKTLLEDCDYDGAIAAYEEAKEMNDEDPQIYLGMANVYVTMADEKYENGDFEAALDYYNKALDVLNEGAEKKESDEITEYIAEVESNIEDVNAAIEEKEAAEAEEAEAEAEAEAEEEEAVEEDWEPVYDEAAMAKYEQYVTGQIEDEAGIKITDLHGDKTVYYYYLSAKDNPIPLLVFRDSEEKFPPSVCLYVPATDSVGEYIFFRKWTFQTVDEGSVGGMYKDCIYTIKMPWGAEGKAGLPEDMTFYRIISKADGYDLLTIQAVICDSEESYNDSELGKFGSYADYTKKLNGDFKTDVYRYYYRDADRGGYNDADGNHYNSYEEIADSFGATDSYKSSEKTLLY